MPPPQHPGNSKQVVPSGRMNQVVPPWQAEKRPSVVLTPARGISPKAGSPPPSPIIKVKDECEPDWGGDDPATPGTSPGTPPRTQPGCWDDAPYWMAGRLCLDEVDDDQNGEMMHWNIETGSQQQVWPSEMSEKAISFKGSDGAQVAVLVREFALDHMRDCEASNVIRKIFKNRPALEEAIAYERRHWGTMRKYDGHLRVTDGEKLVHMARLPSQIVEEEGSPDPKEYVKRMPENERNLARFNRRCLYLAKLEEDDWRLFSEDQQKIALLLRLLRLSLIHI